ncbi:MAG TPA: VWA domain-containing protein [Vicinamibacteria bacterium]|nr:VWA domain-containing protein [Vicinamibacteria bacterium]
MSRPWIAAPLLIALPWAWGAEQKTPVFPAGVDVVNITVTVRDAQGRLVTDLDAQDFLVREDGRPQLVQLFGRATEPGHQDALALDLGLLLDTSESMQEQMRLTQESAVRFLDSIPRARDLIMIFFDQDIRVSRYSSENQQGLFERILETKSAGTTALYDAISVYISRVQDSPGRKVLLVFTDGEDTTSAISLFDLIQLVRSSSVTIYPIAFLGSFGMGSKSYVTSKACLNQLADVSGGQVYNPLTSKDLAGIYDKILDELKGQYVVGFVSDSPRKDGKFRRLKVEVSRNKETLRVRHRAGYYAPGDGPRP